MYLSLSLYVCIYIYINIYIYIYLSSSKRSGTRRDPATDIINNSQKGLAQPYS